MKKRYERRVSETERFWIMMEKLSPPYSNQMVLEGKSDSFDVKEWQKAVETAAEANPGSRVKFKGFFKSSRWVDSYTTPDVKLITAHGWDGLSNHNAPFLSRRLSIKSGKPCEVLLIDMGEKKNVIFRSLHAVMDGRGTMTFAEDVFRVLNGKEPKGSSDKSTEVDIAKTFQSETRVPFPREHLAPTGRADLSKKGISWKRIVLKSKVSKILPSVIFHLADYTLSKSSGVVRFAIPVDLRNRKPGIRSTGNLSIAIYVEVDKSSTISSIEEDIKTQLKEKKDGVLTSGDLFLEYVPIWLMEIKARSIIANQYKNGRYAVSGIVSNLGRVDRELFTGGGFTPDNVFFIPPGMEGLPVFVGISGMDGNVDLVFSMPEKLGSNGRFDSLIEKILEGITKND